MVSHLVLLTPRAHLSLPDRQLLVASFKRAIDQIPGVRGVRVGRRVTHGAGYEARMPAADPYLIAIDFDDLGALQTYLRHPAHEELAGRFNESLSSALVYDFEVTGAAGLDELLKDVLGD
jgi:hypothetical protein